MNPISNLMEENIQERITIFREIFCNNLKKIRAEKNYSQKEVAEKLGIHTSSYANWEQGRREPSVYDIFSLIWVFDIDANELFNIEAGL